MLIFKELTNTVPVIGVMADPVAYGVVSILARPGGNVTGVSVDAGLEVWAKRLQSHAGSRAEGGEGGIPQFALQLGSGSGESCSGRSETARNFAIRPPARIPCSRRRISSGDRIMAGERVDGLLVSDIADNFTYRRLIVRLAEEARLPTIYPYPRISTMGI